MTLNNVSVSKIKVKSEYCTQFDSKLIHKLHLFNGVQLHWIKSVLLRMISWVNSFVDVCIAILQTSEKRRMVWKPQVTNNFIDHNAHINQSNAGVASKFYVFPQ